MKINPSDIIWGNIIWWIVGNLIKTILSWQEFIILIIALIALFFWVQFTPQNLPISDPESINYDLS